MYATDENCSAAANASVDADIAAATATRSAVDAHSRQSAVLQRTAKESHARAVALELQIEQWRKREREFRYRTALLEESFKKNETLHMYARRFCICLCLLG
jgi:hypothetical protein